MIKLETNSVSIKNLIVVTATQMKCQETKLNSTERQWLVWLITRDYMLAGGALETLVPGWQRKGVIEKGAGRVGVRTFL